MSALAAGFEAYVAIDAVNFSTLKNIATSPRHYRHAKDNDRPDTDTFRKGRALHTLVLEPHKFEREYAVYEGRRDGKKWDAFEAEHEGLCILTRKQYDDAVAMARAVRAHPVAAAYLTRGEAERTLTWTDPETGLRCKARLDWICHGLGAVVDLKTAKSIAERDFKNAMARLNYPGQLAHYVNGAKACDIFVDPIAVIIAVENVAPFDVAVFRLTSLAMQAGASSVSEMMTTLKACTDADQWPGQFPTETSLDLPTWATFGEIEMSYIESEAS